MIDAHIHLWTIEPDRYPWHPTLADVPIPTVPATVEEFLEDAASVSLDAAIAVQPSAYGWDNSYLCAALGRDPERLVGICMVDPLSRSAAEDLHHWYKLGCRGLRINTITQVDTSWLLGPTCSALLEVADRLAIPVELQVDLAHGPAVVNLARRFPDLCIVLEYLGAGSMLRRVGIESLSVLGACPTIHLKLLMATEESHRPWPHDDLWPFYSHALQAFGADRLMFGSSWPSQRRYMDYSRTWRWTAEWPFLTPVQRDLLHDGTARQVFLPDHRSGSA